MCLLYLSNMISNNFKCQIWFYVAYYIFQVLQATSQVGPSVLLKFVMGGPGKTHLTTVSRVNATKSSFQTDFQHFSPPPLTHTHTLYPHQHHYWGNIFQSCVWNFASDGGHLAAAWVRGHSGLVYPGQALKLGREILPCSRQQGSRQPQGSSPQSGLTFMNEPIREGFQKSTKLNVL